MPGVERTDLIKIAKLYYHGDCSQEQIAKVMGFSRPKISRLLTMARDLKIVEFKITESPVAIERMERKLAEFLNLDKVWIVPSNTDKRRTLLAAGAVAGEYLNEILAPNMRIGISWGGTMDLMVTQFKPAKEYRSVMVVQMIGGTPSSSFNVDSRELTLRFANKLNASYSLLQAPQYVSSKAVKDTLMKEPEFIAHFKLLAHLDAAVIGISSVVPEHSVSYRAGYISLKETKALSASGFVTDICGNRLYKDGTTKHNDINDRLIAISPQCMKRIPKVVAVAIGEDKAKTITIAAKGGFFNTLITDEVAAISILGR